MSGGIRNDVGKECGVSLFGWKEEMRKNEALNYESNEHNFIVVSTGERTDIDNI